METPDEAPKMIVESPQVESHVTSVRRPSTRFSAITIARPTGFDSGIAQVIELGTLSGERGFFAISSPPGADGLDVLIKASTPRSTFEDLAVGAPVTIGGPWGLGYDAASEPYLWLLGIGSAYSALRGALLAAIEGGRRADTIHLMLGVRYFADIPDIAELAAWAKAGVAISLAVSGGSSECLSAASGAGWQAAPGRLPSLIAAIPPNIAREAAVRVAGSEEAEDTIVAALVAHGVTRAQIQRNFHPDARTERTTIEVAPA